jgi:hypothetical protein
MPARASSAWATGADRVAPIRTAAKSVLVFIMILSPVSGAYAPLDGQTMTSCG